MNPALRGSEGVCPARPPSSTGPWLCSPSAHRTACASPKAFSALPPHTAGADVKCPGPGNGMGQRERLGPALHLQASLVQLQADVTIISCPVTVAQMSPCETSWWASVSAGTHGWVRLARRSARPGSRGCPLSGLSHECRGVDLGKASSPGALPLRCSSNVSPEQEAALGEGVDLGALQPQMKHIS